MDRRRALAGLAGGVTLAAGGVRADEPKPNIPGAIKLEMGKEIKIGARSSPVKVDRTELHLLSIGDGTFLLDKESRLTAKLKAAVTQYAKIDYWVTAAVFDAAGKFLGAAAHKVAVQYVRLGAIPTLFSEIVLDFGISKAFKDAALVAVAIGDRDVPAPG